MTIIQDMLFRSMYDGKGSKEAIDALHGLDGAGKSAAGGLSGATGGLVSLQGIAGKLIAAGTLYAIASGVREIWQAGTEGAQADLTVQSFENFAGSTVLAADQLEVLRAASNGTITDLGLIQGVTTALAGTTGVLKDSLSESSDELLMMARSASLLNPQLGDTAFMYESIVKGIRRGSPMILDNLGIIVKIGEANEAYAESLGKTVDQLTSEERSMALLNATLETGNSLNEAAAQIDTERADAIQQLNVKWENLKNMLQMGVAPAVAGAASVVGILVDELIEAAKVIDFLRKGEEGLNQEMADQQRIILQGSVTWKDYVRQILEARKEQGTLAPVIANNLILATYQAELTEKQTEDIEHFTAGILGVTEATYNETMAVLALADAQEEQVVVQERVVTEMEILKGLSTELAVQLRSDRADWEAQNDILNARADFLEENNAAMREMAQVSQQTTKAVSDNFKKMWGAIDLGLSNTISSALDNLEFLELGGAELQSAYDQIFYALSQKQITPEQAQAAFQALFVEATELEVMMGEISPQEGLQKIADELGIPLSEAKELMDGIVDAASIIDGLRAEIRINVSVSGSQLALAIASYIFSGGGGSLGFVADDFGAYGSGDIGTTGAGGAGSGGGAEASGGQTYAEGGSFVIPPGHENHDWPLGPDGRVGKSGETVTVTPAGQSPMAPTILVQPNIYLDGEQIAYRMDDYSGREARRVGSAGGYPGE